MVSAASKGDLELARAIAEKYAEGLKGLEREDCEELGISEDCELFRAALNPSPDGKIDSIHRTPLEGAGYSDEFIDELELQAPPARVEWLSKYIVTGIFQVDYSRMERAWMIRELGQFGGMAAKTVPDLIEIAEDDDGSNWCDFKDFVYDNFDYYMCHIDWMDESFCSECPSLELAAIQAFGGIGPAARDAVPMLRARLSGNWRSYVINALGGIGEGASDAAPELLAMGQSMYTRIKTEDLTRDVAGAMARRLQGMFPQVTRSDVETARFRLVNLDTQDDRSELYRIMDALGNIASNPDEAIPFLIDLTEAENGAHRQYAVENIAKFRIDDMRIAAPALLRCLDDVDYNVSSSAAKALVKLGHEIVPSLAGKIRNRGRGTRVLEALGVLVAIKPADEGMALIFMEVLANAEGRYYDDERAAAAAALGEMGTPIAAIPLLRLVMLSEYTGLRSSAAYAMGKVEPDARKIIVDDLMRALDDKHYDVRAAAALALGKIGPDAAVAEGRLIEMAGNKEENVNVRHHAIVSLGHIGSPEAEAVLIDCMGDDEKYEHIQGCAVDSFKSIEDRERYDHKPI